MENNIPVPTDNIFKFYALFGLLLFVFSFGALIYTNSSSNNLIMEVFPELEGLRQIEKPSRAEAAKIALMERRLQVTMTDKKFYAYALGGLGGIAVIAMIYGFRKWHMEVQPVLDQTAEVQLEIAKLQLEQLRRELGFVAKPSASSLPVEGGAAASEPTKP